MEQEQACEHDWKLTGRRRSISYIRIRKWDILTCEKCKATKEEQTQ